MPTAPDDANGTAAASPGSSSPGEPGYEGRATVGDEGAGVDAESFDDPFGRPDTSGVSARGQTGKPSGRPSEADG